jgi:signal transduction histidine kinase
MMSSDPLRTAELLALLEEATTPLRHDVRNRLASLRNLAFFVRRKLAKEENPERDPRVGEFLVKIEDEVQSTDGVMDAWSARVQAARPLELRPVQVTASVRLAIECARVPPDISLVLAAADDALLIDGDPQTLAVAVRCLLENASDAIGSGSVSVRVARDLDHCVVTVAELGMGIADHTNCTECFESTKPGHLGLGLCVARRVATRSGGALLIGHPERGAEVSLRIPLTGNRRPSGPAA